jgi:uncharacterized protein YqeY
MSLKTRVSDEIKAAMKARDKLRLETLRSIKKVILEKETAVRPAGQDELTAEQELEVLTQLAKQRKDSVTQYQNAGRDDLAEKEAQELAIIEEYLPQQLSDDDVAAIIDGLIAQTGATTAKRHGQSDGASHETTERPGRWQQGAGDGES